ncbi:MAG: hypothetical protein PF487_08955 [Bacteroidales bacterium]|nr:hypothetical protein [Bacteroidales bacterium]
MIKNSVLMQIEDWKKDNNIKAKEKFIPLLECYRRIYQFNNGNIHEKLLIPALPSEVKGAKEYFEPSYSRITPRVINWYKLTNEGKRVINNLMNRISWNRDELNQWIFDLNY